MPARLQDCPGDLSLLAHPALEVAEPGAVRAEAEDRPPRLALALVADRRDVLALADVDANGLHTGSSHAIIRPGELASSVRRPLIPDHRSALVHRRRVPITVPERSARAAH